MDPEYHRTIYPNRSLTRAGALGLAIFLAVVALLLTIGSVVLGAWPVLLFVLAEAIGACCIARWLVRHRLDQETVHVGDREVDVVQRVADRFTHSHFPRGWTRVTMMQGDALRSPRVLIGSHGRSVEVGAALIDEDRARLADELRRAVRIR